MLVYVRTSNEALLRARVLRARKAPCRSPLITDILSKTPKPLAWTTGSEGRSVFLLSLGGMPDWCCKFRRRLTAYRS